MNQETWNKSLENQQLPQGLSPIQQALWYCSAGDWNKAHEIVQVINSPQASRIHAFLHRQEGDNWNADYWYSRAGTTRPNVSQTEELNQLLQDFVFTE